MSLPRPESDEFFTLLFDLREGRLDAARWEKLTALLEQDETARRRYLEMMQLCADLKWRNLSPTPQLAPPSGERLASPPPAPRSGAVRYLNRSAVFSAISAMATVAAGVTLLALVNRPARPIAAPAAAPAAAPRSEVATLIGGVDVQWAGPRPAPRERVLAGRWELDAGVCELQLDNGVELIVEGPADFDLQTVGQIRLDHGRLAVRVPPAAHGFRVLTPQAELIDLGTEFGVVVDSIQATDVVVYQGLVEVHSLAHPSAPRRLSSGQKHTAAAARIDQYGIAPLASFPSDLLRSLPPPGKYQWTPAQARRTTRDGAGADAYVQGNRGEQPFADWHFGGESHLWLKPRSENFFYTRFVYLRFDLADLPDARWQQGRLTLTSNYDAINLSGAWRLQVWGLMEAEQAPSWLEVPGTSAPAAPGVLCWNRAPGLDPRTGNLRREELRQLAELPLPGNFPRSTRLTIDLSEPPFRAAWKEWIHVRQGRTATLILQAVRVSAEAKEKHGWSFCSKDNLLQDVEPPTLELLGVSRRAVNALPKSFKDAPPLAPSP